MKKIIPDWPAPRNIHAFTTVRSSIGVSAKPYHSFNLANHVGDNPEHVQLNRALLIKHSNLPCEPAWLNQTHSSHCITIEKDNSRDADAAITRQPDIVLAIMTADCVPIVLCDRLGQEVAAIHAGWRGLVNGIISNTLKNMQTSTDNLLAWIGPAICGSCYEVGDEVYRNCIESYPFSQSAFSAKNGKWLANLPLAAEMILQKYGVKSIYQSKGCTFEQKNDFFSYRREAETGRIATLIWFS